MVKKTRFHASAYCVQSSEERVKSFGLLFKYSHGENNRTIENIPKPYKRRPNYKKKQNKKNTQNQKKNKKIESEKSTSKKTREISKADRRRKKNVHVLSYVGPSCKLLVVVLSQHCHCLFYYPTTTTRSFSTHTAHTNTAVNRARFTSAVWFFHYADERQIEPYLSMQHTHDVSSRSQSFSSTRIQLYCAVFISQTN